ncbi:MAG: hypothetical protein PVH84_02825 [Candidatus Aminicenantes bacterium]|jgi:hypothetical protein
MGDGYEMQYFDEGAIDAFTSLIRNEKKPFPVPIHYPPTNIGLGEWFKMGYGSPTVVE